MSSVLYRFLIIRFFSSLGDQILLFAVPLLVYQTTKSISLSGLAFFIEWLPRVISLPFAGVFSDKFGGRKVYLFADLIRACVCLLGFALLYSLPSYTFYIVSILMAICALCYAQAFIAQEATIPKLVIVNDLPKAQSFVQSIEQMNMILGPLFASFIAYYFPLIYLIVFAALIFMCSYIGMLMIPAFNTASNDNETKKLSVLTDMKMGALIILQNKKLVWLCMLTIVGNLLWGFALSTGAAMVTGIFKKTTIEFGLLQTIVGICSIAILLLTSAVAKRMAIQWIGIISYSAIILGGLLLSIGVSYWFFALGYILVLAMDGMFNVYIRTERVLLIPKEHLGKTIGLIVLINQLSVPLAGLLVANFAANIGVQNLILIGTIIAAIFSLVYIWQNKQSQKHIPATEFLS